MAKKIKEEKPLVREFSKELEVADKYIGKSKKTGDPFYTVTFKGWGHDSKHFVSEEEYHRLVLGDRRIFDFQIAEKFRDGFWNLEPRLVLPPVVETTEEL